MSVPTTLPIPAMNPDIPRWRENYNQEMAVYLRYTIAQIQAKIAAIKSQLPLFTGDPKLYQQALLNGLEILLKQILIPSTPPPLARSLFFYCTPSFTEVTVDNVRLPGRTPYKVGIVKDSPKLPETISPGRHTYTALAGGYDALTQTFLIPPDQDISLYINLTELPEKYYKVNFTSTPSGARILIDNKDAMIATPASLKCVDRKDISISSEITPGPHTATFKLSGYKDVDKAFTASLTKNVDVAATMTLVPAEVYKVNITCNVSNAKIYVDGVYTNHYAPETYIIGAGPVTTHIPPGERKIRLDRAGYVPQEKTVTVTSTANLAIDFVLQPTAPPPPPPPPPPPVTMDWKKLDTLIANVQSHLDALEAFLAQYRK